MSITRKLPAVHAQPPQPRSLLTRVLASQRQRDEQELASAQERIEALLLARLTIPARKGNEAC